MDGKLMRIFFIFTSLSRGVHGGFTIPPTLLFSLILNYKFKCIFLQSPLFLLFHSVVFFIFLCKCWEHTASPLFCLGSGGGWCHVCDVHILTQCYLFFCKYSQEKNSCCFLLFFFFPVWSFSEPDCFSNCPIFSLSKFEEPLYLVVYWKSCSCL